MFEKVIATVEEIQERHDAVMEIEKRLHELHQVASILLVVTYTFPTLLICFFFLKLNFVIQVFMDMAVLVEAQGEILDNIECQVCYCTFTVYSST